MVAVALLATVMLVTVNVAVVELAATVTEAGTVAADVLLLERDTTAPPVGAGPLSVTVPVELALPPTTVVGDRLTDCATGGLMVSEAVCWTLL